MKFQKLIENTDDADYSVVDYTIANAHRVRQRAVDKYEQKVKELDIAPPNEAKDAHTDISSAELKKMHLAESLFTELRESIDFDVTPVTTKLLDAVTEGILDPMTVLIACVKYMGENDVARMVDANEFLFDESDILEEDLDDFEYRSVSGVRYNKKNLSDLSDTVTLTIPETKLVYEVYPGVQWEKDSNLLKSSIAELRLTSDSESLLTTACRNAVRTALPDYKTTVDVHSLVHVPSCISVVRKSTNDTQTEYTESIDTHSSHADSFIKALRSAGFGDGFDQKLIIDEYSTGTRIEYKDQGGHFAVVIMEDKITLEGQDEGEKPFKKEFTTWSEFAKEFQELYPGVPVHESNKMLNEAKKLPAMINNYEREDGARYLVYKTREPLASVIEAELTSGEICYLEKNGKVTQSVMPHKDYPVSQVSVQWDEWDMPYVKLWGPSKEYFDAAIEVAKKYNKDYEIHADKYAVGPRKYWLEIIVTDEDTEEPYYDPAAPVVGSQSSKQSVNSDLDMTKRHAKDNEDLEDSQRYPIKSPAPAQTGLAMMEEAKVKRTAAELNEDVMMNGALNEVRISTEGIRNFRPWGTGVVTFNNILEAGKMDAFEALLEETHPEGIGAVELNDYLSFSDEDIYNQLGMTEYID